MLNPVARARAWVPPAQMVPLYIGTGGLVDGVGVAVELAKPRRQYARSM